MTSQPGWGPPQPVTPTQRPWYKRAWFIVAATLVTMLLLFSGCVAVVGGALNDASRELSPADAPKETIGASPTTQPAAPTTDRGVSSGYDTPRVAHFTLTVKTLSKECFGSAGCNVSFRVEAGWEETYDPDKEYELTYKVIGGEDARVETMRIQGDEYERITEDFIGTRTSRSKLRAVPVSVEEV